MNKMTTAAAACVSLALGACSLLPANEEWEALPSHSALPAAFQVVDSNGIERNCGNPPGMYIHGCAQRDYGKRTCIVFTRADPRGWLIEHEKKHCDGWDHASADPTFPGIATLAATPLTPQGHAHDPEAR
jgi:hypothetical protein